MIDEFAKSYLHDELRWAREAIVARLEGLPEYDVRRPLTATGTNLLGLAKHLASTEARPIGAGKVLHGRDVEYWAERRTAIENAAAEYLEGSS